MVWDRLNVAVMSMACLLIWDEWLPSFPLIWAWWQENGGLFALLNECVMDALCNGGAPRAFFWEALEKWTLTTAQMFKRPFFCFDARTVCLFDNSFVCLRKPLLADMNATPALRGKMRVRYSNGFITAHKYSGTISLTRTSNRMRIVSGFYNKIIFSFSSSHLFHLCSFCRITLQNISPARVSSSTRSSFHSPYLLSLTLAHFSNKRPTDPSISIRQGKWAH